MIPILIALILTFPFIYKYSFVITNQFSQIPIILSFLNPVYLSNDWYVSVSKDFGPRTIFAWYMAQTAKILSLPLTFFFHYLLYIFLVAYSSYRLSCLIFKNKFIALTTTICLFFGTSITLGGNILVTADFSAPQLPLGLILLGIVYLIERKYLSSALLFAIASYLHPLIGFESAILFFTSIFLTLISLKKPVIPFIKKALIPYLVTTLPVFVLYAREALSKNIANIDKVYIHAYMRNPHHYIASTWPISNFIHFFIFLAAFILFLLWSKNRVKPFLLRIFVFSILFILISCLIGFWGTEIVASYPLTALQTFRLTLYLYWLGTVIIIGSLFSAYFRSKSKYAFLFLTPIFISNTQIFDLSKKVNLAALVIAFLLVIFFQKMPRKLFIFFLIIFFSLFRYHDKFNFSSYINYPTEDTKIALWVKENTLPYSIFLIPPEFESFRLVAERAIVVDWKAFPFQEKAMSQWAERICDVGNIKSCSYKEVTQEKVIKGYRTLSENDILNLIQKYNFQYIITDLNYPSFEKIYNNGFFIYKVKLNSLYINQ